MVVLLRQPLIQIPLFFSYFSSQTAGRFGAFPKAGDSFEFENLKVTVLKMDGMRVERVRVEVKE